MKLFWPGTKPLMPSTPACTTDTHTDSDRARRDPTYDRCMRAILVGLVFAIGCSSPTQVMTGRIDPGFPSEITTVKVTTSSIQSWHGDALVTTSPVAADGTFRLETPPLGRVHLLLLAENGKSTVVFPRQSGVIHSAFTIRPNGAPFDLGGIRYVGDSSTTTFAFRTVGGTGEAECEDDGMDANGAMCVDDEDDNQNTCGQNDENEQEGEHEDDEGENDDGENEDDDGENEDGEHEDDGEHDDPEDGPDMGDALAEHNFPADGCSDEDDDEDEDEDEDD